MEAIEALANRRGSTAAQIEAFIKGRRVKGVEVVDLRKQLRRVLRDAVADGSLVGTPTARPTLYRFLKPAV